MRELLAELTTALARRLPCVYCSVVETRGSTPQKAGAAMLVFPDGSQAGTLGGGCVEAEVKQRALRCLTDGGGAPDVLTFCLDDDYGWDDGLICGGRMTILADPLTNAECGMRNAESKNGPVGEAPREGASLDSAFRTPLSTLEYYVRFRQLIERGTGCTEAVALEGNALG